MCKGGSLTVITKVGFNDYGWNYFSCLYLILMVGPIKSYLKDVTFTDWLRGARIFRDLLDPKTYETIHLNLNVRQY